MMNWHVKERFPNLEEAWRSDTLYGGEDCGLSESDLYHLQNGGVIKVPVNDEYVVFLVKHVPEVPTQNAEGV